MNFELPQTLTASMLNQWVKSPSDFYKRYFLREEQADNPYRILGRKISKELEHLANTGEISDEAYNIPMFEEIAGKVVHFENAEVKIQGEVLPGLDMIGYLDGAEGDFSEYVDHKVSEKPWTQERVESSPQFKLYSLYIWKTYGILPKVHVSNILVRSFARGALLEPTGEVNNFTVEYTPDDMEIIEGELLGLVNAISGAYKVFKDPSLVPLNAIKEIVKVAEEEKALKKRKDDLRSEVIPILESLGLTAVLLETAHCYKTSKPVKTYGAKEDENYAKEQRKALEDLLVKEEIVILEDSESWTIKKRK